jgi:hypothetical protein
LRLVSLDGSTLNVPDEKINKDYFGHTNTYVENGYIYPQLRFVCLAETGTHVLFASQLGTYRESEVSLSREVIKNLQPGMLCLADRGFCYHSLWCQAVSTGAELLWRGRHHVIFPVEDILPDGSYISTFVPKEIRRIKKQRVKVRIIDYKIQGLGNKDKTYRLITSLLDYKTAPASELAALYHERWEAENCLDEFKTHLMNGRDYLRSKTPDLVKQEFYGLLLAHFAIRGLMHEAALSVCEDPDGLSFTHTLNTLKRKIIFFSSFSPSSHKSLSSKYFARNS